jgi:hypothetical protein
MLSPEEHSYLQKKPLKRLTYDGVNDLYLHPIFGAYTIKQCIELEAIKIPPPVKLPMAIPVSDELMGSHNYCVENYGCGFLLGI